MVSSCCAPFCTNRATKATRGRGNHFYRIPRKGLKRQQWLAALRRKDFNPGPNTYLCREGEEEIEGERGTGRKGRMMDGENREKERKSREQRERIHRQK